MKLEEAKTRESAALSNGVAPDRIGVDPSEEETEAMMNQGPIRRMKDGEHKSCEQILRSLPDWFGIEQAICDYVRDLQVMETWIAESGSVPLGFLTVHQHNESSAEIHVLAVLEEHHGQGWGRLLIEQAEQGLRSRSIEFLQVKTLAPSRQNAHYERTRGFYWHMGFKPLEENRLWGVENPCLIMVKHLPCSGNTGSR